MTTTDASTIETITWTIYISDGSEIMEPGMSEVIVTRDAGYLRYDSAWWTGDERYVGNDDVLEVQADQIAEAKRLVEEQAGVELAWDLPDDYGTYPYGWAAQAVQYVDHRPELTEPWDMIRFSAAGNGQALGYDDPSDIGRYHVQYEGQWRSSHDTYEAALRWLTDYLGFKVVGRHTVVSAGEERWDVEPAD